MSSSQILLILRGRQLPILLLLIIQCLKVLIVFLIFQCCMVLSLILIHQFLLMGLLVQLIFKVPPNLFDGFPMCPGLMARKYSLS